MTEVSLMLISRELYFFAPEVYFNAFERERGKEVRKKLPPRDY
jgi:hypothetical protein